MGAQLPLNLRLRDASSFDNFLPATNRELLDRLRSISKIDAPPAFLFLWGEAGSGKTHLLQAACRAMQQAAVDTAYVPLAAARELAVELLEDREQAALVCLDDVDCIAGDPNWEPALFALCERLRAARGRLIACARAAPGHLGLRLPELATRLASGPVYQLHALTDAEKIEAIRLRAGNRGLEISDEVAHYIFKRFPRDLHSLFELLDRIDRLALESRRRITIPLIRELDPAYPNL